MRQTTGPLSGVARLFRPLLQDSREQAFLASEVLQDRCWGEADLVRDLSQGASGFADLGEHPVCRPFRIFERPSTARSPVAGLSVTRYFSVTRYEGRVAALPRRLDLGRHQLKVGPVTAAATSRSSLIQS